MKRRLVELRDKFFWQTLRNYVIPECPSVALDLGSGLTVRNDFAMQEAWGVDIRDNDVGRVVYADLAHEDIPFDSGHFGVVTAYDFLEHVPRALSVEGKLRFPLVNLMNEIYRVLAPGGLFYSYTPVWPTAQAFEDPTHVNFMTRSTLKNYFCENPQAAAYGFHGSFQFLRSGKKGVHQFALLRKPASAQP